MAGKLPNEIHDLLLAYWKKLLESGGDIPASQIKEIRQYLADNDIGANEENNPEAQYLLDEIDELGFTSENNVLPLKRFK